MSVALRHTMTRDDFLAWAEGQEGRYEFDGFQPVAMTVAAGYCKDNPQPTRTGGFSRARSFTEGVERS